MSSGRVCLFLYLSYGDDLSCTLDVIVRLMLLMQLA